jgi:hypothetical protein
VSLDDYEELIQSLPCVVCWKKLGEKTYGVEKHHPTVPRNPWLVVPLCREHHQGPTGVHGMRRRGFDTFWKVDDYVLLGWTNEAVAKFT